MTEWSPIVYGRTHLVDHWWRAWPKNEPTNGWAGEALMAIVNNGEDLERREAGALENTSRFLLARDESGTLVGMVCPARVLSESMNTDGQAGRSLYCFVGWFTADSRTADVPSLGELTEHGPVWGAALYHEFVGPVWKLPEHRTETQVTQPGSAPWKLSLRGSPGLLLPMAPGTVYYLPEWDAAEYWERAARTQEPFALSVGWQQRSARPTHALTHMCVEGVTAENCVRQPERYTGRRPAAGGTATGPASTGAAPLDDYGRQHQPYRPPVPPALHASISSPGAIVRYLARSVGLLGDSDREQHRALYEELCADMVPYLNSADRKDVEDAVKQCVKYRNQAAEARRKAASYDAGAQDELQRILRIRSSLGLSEPDADRTDPLQRRHRPDPPPTPRLPDRQARQGRLFGEFGEEP